MQIDVFPDQLDFQIEIPLKEMKLAVPFDVSDVKNLTMENKILVDYLNQHFKITDFQNQPWKLQLQNIKVKSTEQEFTGKYEELIVNYIAVPTTDDPRSFRIFYDAVMHQLVSHRTIVVVRQDWETGKTGEQNTEISTLSYNLNQQKVPHLDVNLEQGNNWTGFLSMVKLGMKHISEGTDHLMFLLALLLTAPLVLADKKWKVNPSLTSSLKKILKITIAFTIGHSITLILATLFSFKFPAQLVEIVIALSILITAIHAIKPIFPDKETWVALIFGLIHGLAFSGILADLNLTKGRLVLSLFGFNIGIELMQIIVIFLVMPWLLMLSKFKIFMNFKNLLAVFAIVAALSWMYERITEKPTFISHFLQVFKENSILFVVFLIVFTTIFSVFKFKKNNL